MKKLSIVLLTLIAVAFWALPSQALSPVRIGEKNFERGWLRLSLGNREKAVEYFSVGAQAFAEALDEKPRRRQTSFPSNLIKAGMTFYFAERFEEVVPVMVQADSGYGLPWEVPMFSALASARRGSKADTISWLDAYFGLSAGQRLFSKAAREQRELLVQDKTSVGEAAKVLDAAMIRQFWYNTGTQRQVTARGQDTCGGSFWWRHAFKPCRRSVFRP